MNNTDDFRLEIMSNEFLLQEILHNMLQTHVMNKIFDRYDVPEYYESGGDINELGDGDNQVIFELMTDKSLSKRQMIEAICLLLKQAEVIDPQLFDNDLHTFFIPLIENFVDSITIQLKKNRKKLQTKYKNQEKEQKSKKSRQLLQKERTKMLRMNKFDEIRYNQPEQME